MPQSIRKNMSATELVDAIYQQQNTFEDAGAPSIYKLSMVRCDHRSGYDVHAEMRASRVCISTHGDTLEDALVEMASQLAHMYTPCPRCGRGGAR